MDECVGVFCVTIYLFIYSFDIFRAFRSGTCGERTRGGAAPAEDHRVPAEASATRGKTERITVMAVLR